jgi:hypothetical protein
MCKGAATETSLHQGGCCSTFASLLHICCSTFVADEPATRRLQQRWCVCVRERGREGDREVEREIETDRQTDKQSAPSFVAFFLKK